MNLNEYQAQALRTSGAGHDREKNGLLGLIGECGEVVDIIKKWKFQSGNDPVLPRESLIKECGDILWYCAEFASGIERPLGDMLEDKEAVFTKFGHTLETVSVAMVSEAATAYFGLPSTRPRHVRMIYVYLLYLLSLIGTTIEHVAEVNIAKLRARYPDGFDPERSIHRPEYANAENERKDGESESVLLFNQRNRTI